MGRDKILKIASFIIDKECRLGKLHGKSRNSTCDQERMEMTKRFAECRFAWKIRK